MNRPQFRVAVLFRNPSTIDITLCKTSLSRDECRMQAPVQRWSLYHRICKSIRHIPEGQLVQLGIFTAHRLKREMKAAHRLSTAYRQRQSTHLMGKDQPYVYPTRRHRRIAGFPISSSGASAERRAYEYLIKGAKGACNKQCPPPNQDSKPPKPLSSRNQSETTSQS